MMEEEKVQSVEESPIVVEEAADQDLLSKDKVNLTKDDSLEKLKSKVDALGDNDKSKEEKTESVSEGTSIDSLPKSDEGKSEIEVPKIEEKDIEESKPVENPGLDGGTSKHEAEPAQPEENISEVEKEVEKSDAGESSAEAEKTKEEVV